MKGVWRENREFDLVGTAIGTVSLDKVIVGGEYPGERCDHRVSKASSGYP